MDDPHLAKRRLMIKERKVIHSRQCAANAGSMRAGWRNKLAMDNFSDELGKGQTMADKPVRWSAKKKAELVLQLLRGESIDELSRKNRLAVSIPKQIRFAKDLSRSPESF